MTSALLAEPSEKRLKSLGELVRPKPRIGFLRRTHFQEMPRWAFRQITGVRAFQPVVLTGKKPHGPAPATILLVRLKKERRLRWWRKWSDSHLLGAPAGFVKGGGRPLLRAVGEHDVKLLHIFYGTEAIRHLPWLRFIDVPVAVSFHGLDLNKCLDAPDFRKHLPALFERAQCFMVRSKFMEEKLLVGGCPPAKIWINRSGVPLENFPFRARNRQGRPPTFIQVCRFTRKKGLRISLEAFREVAQKIPGARFWIAGKGPLRRELEQWIEEFGLTRSVTLLGFLDEERLAAALQEADLFIHPSLTTADGDEEGIPNALLEAMATGLPPIVTRHAGIPEVVQDGRTGWLVGEGSTDELAERMLSVLERPELLDDVGRRARQLIEEEYALDLRMRLLDAKYGEILEAASRTRTRPWLDRVRGRLLARPVN